MPRSLNREYIERPHGRSNHNRNCNQILDFRIQGKATHCRKSTDRPFSASPRHRECVVRYERSVYSVGLNCMPTNERITEGIRSFLIRPMSLT